MANKLSFQSLYLFFHPHEQQDVIPMLDHFEAAVSPCKENGGATQCSCSTDPNWNVSHPASMTDLFFCLADRCACEDGTTEEIPTLVCTTTIASTRQPDKEVYAIIFSLFNLGLQPFFLIRNPMHNTVSSNTF